MTKNILVGLTILAISTSAALAAKKHAMAKPKAAAAATTSSGPMMIGQVSAADRAMYMKNKRDSGMK